MSASKLSKRLSYIRKSTGPESGKTTGDREEKRPRALPEEWRSAGEYTFIREYILPFEFPPSFETSPLLGRDIPAEGCVFYDTETTGLSGGAGTIAFLIGTGRFSKKGLQVTQYFLSDFPGEEEMLRRFLEEVREDAYYISYNGRAFDSHLLLSRFALNRIRAGFPPQVDLLYPARRLWKDHLLRCSLSTVEEEVLGVVRENDVPGREVPDYYFSFLQTGSFAPLEGIFRHNLQDIVSLALLLRLFHTISQRPSAALFLDYLALGKTFLEHNDKRGLGIIENEYRGGRAEAGVFLAAFYKKLSKWREAVNLWKELWDEGHGLTAGVELAKYYEHREKDYPKALDYVDRLIRKLGTAGAAAPDRHTIDALEYRKRRLLHKIKITTS